MKLEDVSNSLNRIFGRFPARAGSDRELLTMADWTPSVDISETGTAYLIKGEIPGVKEERGRQDHHRRRHDQRHAAQVREGQSQDDQCLGDVKDP